MKIILSIILLIGSLIISGCSSENNDGASQQIDSIIAKPQRDALKKAKNVEKELLKRKKQLDDEEAKY